MSTQIFKFSAKYFKVWYKDFCMAEPGRIFSDTYKDITGKDIAVSARFYKYSGVKSTIRLKDGVLEAKISDLLSDAPEKVLTALAYILISKIRRKDCPKVYQKVYRLWVNSHEMNLRHREIRKDRGHKAKHNPKGSAYDLEELFEELNEKYFSGVLSMPSLCWGTRVTVRKYGHYDPSKHAILISRTLDNEKVPRLVCEFVLYHEMLHIMHDAKQTDYQNRSHHKKFRDDEKKFEKYSEAERWLKILSVKNGLKRKVFGLFG